MRVVDKKLIDKLKRNANLTPRKRTHYLFHNPDDVVQRMVNVMLKGTYVRPHKHVDPDKVEHFVIVEGKVACLHFNDDGIMNDCAILSNMSGVVAVDILPNTFHSFVCLSDIAVLMEFIQGPYDPRTHKKPAGFAPEEDTLEAETYVRKLTTQIRREYI